MAHPLKEHTELLSVIDRLLKLGEEKAATLQQLRKLVLIADLLHLPLAKVEGKVSTYTQEPSPRSFLRWTGAEFVILHNGQEHRFPLVMVPIDLWPTHLRAEYETHLTRKKRNRAGAKPDQY